MLENLGEIIYGNWDRDYDDPLDTNYPITNRLHIIDDCYYTHDDAEWSLIYSILPAQQLADILELGNVCLIGETNSGDYDRSLILLTSGHRIVKTENLVNSNFRKLKMFPELEKIT